MREVGLRSKAGIRTKEIRKVRCLMTTFRLPQENPLYLLAVNFQGVSNEDVKAQMLLILLMP